MSDDEYEPMEGTIRYELRELRWQSRDLLDMILDDLGLPVPDEYPRSESTKEILDDE